MSVLKVDRIEGLTNNQNKIDLTTGGAATAAITTIAVSGSDNVVADSENTTITLAAGSNVTLGVDPTNKAITISATGQLAAANFVGMIAPFATIAPSIGWLLCNGALISTVTYATLFEAIGDKWDTGGEGANEFRVPDLRGAFLRGIGIAGVNTDYVGPTNVGEPQDDQNADHTHPISYDTGHQHTFTLDHTGSGTHGGSGTTYGTGSQYGSYTSHAGGHSHVITNEGGTEVIVYNRGVQFMIKY